jgi:hypothetical protein
VCSVCSVCTETIVIIAGKDLGKWGRDLFSWSRARGSNHVVADLLLLLLLLVFLQVMSCMFGYLFVGGGGGHFRIGIGGDRVGIGWWQWCGACGIRVGSVLHCAKLHTY